MHTSLLVGFAHQFFLYLKLIFQMRDLTVTSTKTKKKMFSSEKGGSDTIFYNHHKLTQACALSLVQSGHIYTSYCALA